MNPSWHSRYAALELPALPPVDEVLLISAPLDLPAARLEALRSTLSARELARAALFATAQLHDRWSAARAILRALLGSALRLAPAEIRFQYGAHGKPELEPLLQTALAGPPLTFNVSHSQGQALYALARGREVGVDLEQMRSRRTDDVARRFFAPEESLALAALEEVERRRAFFSLWSAKEAFIKATGAGLSQSLSSFAFELAWIPPPPGALEPRLLAPVALRWQREVPDAAARWSVHPLAPCDGCSGALVAEGRPRALRLASWDASAPLPIPG